MVRWPSTPNGWRKTRSIASPERGSTSSAFGANPLTSIGCAVPYYAAPCWFTVDPGSLLITSHFNEVMPELPPARLAQEYYGDDVHRLIDVARSRRGISTLYDVTKGDPTSSSRWHQNMALGADQEMIASLRTKAGDVWGALSLYREPGQPMFSEQDLGFVRTVASHLAEGARRALLWGEAMDPDGPDAPGLIVVTDRWDVESASPGIDRWLSDLPGWQRTASLPPCVLAVAAQTFETARRPGEHNQGSISRVHTHSGAWVVLQGIPLVPSRSRRVAVVIEPAPPARIAPLLMSAYQLREREQEVTRLVLQGYSTREIAQRLFLSPHTVQQHLKGVFAKTGVHSRRDLVARIFFTHYEPRLRDNERRAWAGKPMRGGPYGYGAVAED
jgi:DNA-binding CsgD family transcriptional regulator